MSTNQLCSRSSCSRRRAALAFAGGLALVMTGCQATSSGAVGADGDFPSELWSRDSSGNTIRTSCAAVQAVSQDQQMSNQTLYRNAVKDALTVEPEELLPLVSLNRDDPMVTFDEQGRVLLLTVHAYPDSYPQEKELRLQYQCWTFTDKEFAAWFAAREKGVTDWTVRINQMLGMPADRRSTHVTAMWVKPDEVIRPAYRSDVHNPRPADSFATVHAELESRKEADKTAVAAGLHGSMHDPVIYENWFNSRIIASYFSQNDYPWTRLGYTYDWKHAVRADGHNGSCEYGVTEFLVPVDTPVKIAWTMSIDDFIASLRADTAPAAADAAAADAAATVDEPAATAADGAAVAPAADAPSAAEPAAKGAAAAVAHTEPELDEKSK